ncbi:hypothetical protein DUNSADRAFT_367 [Dunaliella salina]|uniref:Uncharacterized protein n=1 Tax=Dunaliella salina TaxID=3046 RepID=A0ABQ7FZ31_DUNSA|nr:hypothetical protein DUNSADRAFT_367 [Dunaliella salina]|eukprot:KAF5827600.1 hypothetical protein DUNSADRAFT_367 [Dunaliella salina]
MPGLGVGVGVGGGLLPALLFGGVIGAGLGSVLLYAGTMEEEGVDIFKEEGTEVKAHSPAEGPADKAGMAAHSVAELRRPSALGFAASFLKN